MTLLTFVKIACVVVTGIYLLSVNLFQKSSKKTGARPEPSRYTFFPKEKNGLSDEEFQKRMEV
ncbi:hypothetical protein P1X15_29820 [Runella sp. MFBS21]|uniref:hypothetical protein n=1 Tax=Runella sp. MFBS21 TaxID=3034018 RepID=UPI0023F8D044|nr:hypothetical protein [Runella sp. MFBS21]MDF7821851.1 hypothetical protein [Runella sp. MFBS21]